MCAGTRAARLRAASARLALVFATCAAGSVATAQPPDRPGDWPMYSRDLAGTRYSPLTEITRRNVNRLEQAWSVPVARGADDDDDAGGPSGNPQATPIVVDGVMYLPVRGHEVLALDAATGEPIWRTPVPTLDGTDARGVGYWPGDGQIGPRIFVHVRAPRWSRSTRRTARLRAVSAATASSRLRCRTAARR